MDSVINLLANDNYIIVNKSLIQELGLNEAILIGEFASEYNFYKKNNMLDEDGSFYSTIDNVKENTGLSRDTQLRAIKNLCERNLISTKLKGVPARRYIQFNFQLVANLLVNISTTRCRKTRQLDVAKHDANNNNNNNNKNNNKYYINKNIPEWFNKEFTLEEPDEETKEEMEKAIKELNEMLT
jgi:hypothetical protein